MTAAVLLVAVAAIVLPDTMPLIFGGTSAAWAYVLHGVESTALWALAFCFVSGMTCRLICAWALFESAQRPICRLAFQMDRPVKLDQGQNLCDAAFGLPMSLLSVVLALFLAALVQEVQHVGRARG